MQNVSLKVIGVLSSKGANMMGMDQDDILIAPWTTVKYRIASSSSGASSQSTQSASSSESKNSQTKMYPSSSTSFYPDSSTASEFILQRFANIDQIVLAARNVKDIPNVIKQITSLLKQRHRIKENEPEDFSIRDMTEMTTALTSTAKLMATSFAAVALISLVVGGVGIMNIMLVSVTERTKEIGLRMAVGARSRDIMQQFLVEAVVLCLVGGIIGSFLVS